MSERGQATIDYTTLLALVAALLAAGAALVPGGARGVANGVRAQTARALCIVTGKACPVDRAPPCTVAMRRETRHFGLTVGVIRLDKDRFVVREQLSDGTVRLTVISRLAGGVEIGVGGRVQIDQDLSSGGFDREARVGAQVVPGVGRVYVARNAREADRIMAAIADGDDPPVPARETFVQGGVGGFGTFSISRGVMDLDWSSTRLLTVRMNRRTGATTLAFSLGNGGRALAGSLVGGPGGAFDGTAVFGLTLDRRQRPVELSLLAIGELAAGVRLPSALAAPLALSGDRDAPANLAGRRWEFAARLDLRDPEVAAAWKRFFRSPASLAAIRGLARTLRERAHLDVRAYSARNSSNGTALGLSLGFRLGGETERMIDRFNLIAASRRPPGGLWEPRLDCI